MSYYLVSPLKITHARESLLTYESSILLTPGQIVSVPVGSRIVPAVVTSKTKQPEFATKPITALIQEVPLPTSLLILHEWLAQYYDSHPVNVWQTMLPSGLLKKRRNSKKSMITAVRDTSPLTLTTEQNTAIERILQKPHGTTLLHGITGSGKTAVYIEIAKKTIEAGRSVIVLVPEIALTSQIVAEFFPHFKNLSVTHSTMTESARHTLWNTLLSATEPQVVIGPRSALFSPVPDLGLIVIDECHEPAFKQEKSPRYSAIRAAAVLAKTTKSRLILGSATPSVVDYYLAEHTPDADVVEMLATARNITLKPSIELVDMTKKHNFSRSQFLSETFLKKLDETLTAGNQALVFHNRRGSAPITLCENCGWNASCPRCYVPLTLHADHYHLRCHLCNYSEAVPTTCPSCQTAGIIHKGIGTKRIFEELTRLFPKARIARFDGDSSSIDTVESQYQNLYDGNIDIIIGTQVIAKGLDLPHLRFVGIVQADSGLALPDFSSDERVFQLIAQVIGRVGRSDHQSAVIIQSYQPTHPSVVCGIAQNYKDFYQYCLLERKRAHFPPFTYLLTCTAVYKTEAGAVRASRELIKKLREHTSSQVEILGPAPAFYERLRDTYRWQIILKSRSRQHLMNILPLLPATGWQTELDPISLL